MAIVQTELRSMRRSMLQSARRLEVVVQSHTDSLRRGESWNIKIAIDDIHRGADTLAEVAHANPGITQESYQAVTNSIGDLVEASAFLNKVAEQHRDDPQLNSHAISTAKRSRKMVEVATGLEEVLRPGTHKPRLNPA